MREGADFPPEDGTTNRRGLISRRPLLEFQLNRQLTLPPAAVVYTTGVDVARYIAFGRNCAQSVAAEDRAGWRAEGDSVESVVKLKPQIQFDAFTQAEGLEGCKVGVVQSLQEKRVATHLAVEPAARQIQTILLPDHGGVRGDEGRAGQLQGRNLHAVGVPPPVVHRTTKHTQIGDAGSVAAQPVAVGVVTQRDAERTARLECCHAADVP